MSQNPDLRNADANQQWGGRFNAGPSVVMQEINASIGFDRKMWRQDIRGSRAHAAMLARLGILSADDERAIGDHIAPRITKAAAFFAGLLASPREDWAHTVLVAIDEAHLLNLTVAPEHQGRGWGGDMLRECLRLAAGDLQANAMLLEVRPSNAAALALYQRAGFRSVGRRRGYYPAAAGREDALVLRRMLP